MRGQGKEGGRPRGRARLQALQGRPPPVQVEGGLRQGHRVADGTTEELQRDATRRQASCELEMPSYCFLVEFFHWCCLRWKTPESNPRPTAERSRKRGTLFQTWSGHSYNTKTNAHDIDSDSNK